MGGPNTQRYLLLERIGFGGMAEVFRANALDAHGRPTGVVVVKKILPHLSADPEYREMFMEEARIAATLDHRNIVRLLDLGRMDDQLFLALELVEGADLDRISRRLRAGGLRFPFAVSAWIVSEVLFGLHHAHSRLAPDGRPLAFVHRDVTPSNILLSLTGEVKLTDFGVAKAAVRGGRTVAGVVKGNTLFMAPEQILGEDVDERADIYSAGLVLLTLLTGKHPFADLNLGVLIDRTLAGTIPPARELSPDVPEELESLVRCATARERSDRFPTAAAFLDALATACHGLGLRAGALDLARIVERLRNGSAEVGAPLPPSIVGRLGPLIANAIEPTPLPQPDPHYDTYRGPMIEATPSTPQVDRSFGLELTPEVPHEFESYRGPLLAASREEEPEMTPFASALFADVEATPAWECERTVIESHDERDLPVLTPVRELVIHAPATHIGTPPVPFAEPNGILRGHRQAVSALALLGRGAVALSASHDQTLRLWEVASREERALLRGHRAAVTSLAVTADGMRAISGGRDRAVRLWNLAEEQEVRALEGHEGWIFAVALDAAARIAASAGMDRGIRIWDLASGKTARVLSGHTDTVSALALFDDGRRALSGSYDRSVKLWDVERGHEIASLECDNGVRAIAVSPDGRRAISGGADSRVTVWDLERGLAKHRLAAHLEPVVCLAFSADGTRCVSGSYDGAARIWDVETGACLRVHHGEDPVMSVAFSPDGAFLLAGRADGTIELWGA